MQIITDLQQMQTLALQARAAGKTIAFVPTMGFLHQGHLSLLEEGRRRGDFLVLSIFVNPAQFGPHEDLDRYPRDFARDEALARQAGVDWLFYPSATDIYPAGYATTVTVSGNLTAILEGASRPGHFQGVATVVAKLFNLVQPHLALFGQKDFQQLAVIRRMTSDLNLPVEIVGMPIVREADGLAMSSRNVYLSPAERRQALALSAVLRQTEAAVAAGELSSDLLLRQATARLTQEPDLQIDYLKICRAATLEDVAEVEADSVLLIAVRIGQTRLIDNHLLAK
ncbi:MAG: pantoate--beta-alanine ligase [Desulfuromonadales bacterium]|nr:pantoate--beta-alanine ligase [Desulfuromonadales bacterium]